MPARPSTKRYRLDRDWILCPGETLAEWFDHVGIPARAARTLSPTPIPEDQLRRFLAGVEPLTDELALQLQDLTGIPAFFWLRLESNYRNGLRAGLTHDHDT